MVVSTAHGLKFTGFKVGYHDQALEDVAARHPNPPLEQPADYAAQSRTIEPSLKLTNRNRCVINAPIGQHRLVQQKGTPKGEYDPDTILYLRCHAPRY